jgi:hypothetical protein
MKKYILTSPRFSGDINVLYGPDNKLLLIDFMRAQLTDEQIEYFKLKLPVVFTPSFYEAFNSSTLTVLEEGYTVTFEQWWNRYKKKHNKIRCEKIWNKLSEADQVNAYVMLSKYERHLTIENWKSKADPDTYLRQRYWESEWK